MQIFDCFTYGLKCQSSAVIISSAVLIMTITPYHSLNPFTNSAIFLL